MKKEAKTRKTQIQQAKTNGIPFNPPKKKHLKNTF